MHRSHTSPPLLRRQLKLITEHEAVFGMRSVDLLRAHESAQAPQPLPF